MTTNNPSITDRSDEIEIAASVERAKEIAKEAGSRMTAIREHVYVSLLRSGQPMKAYDILDTLGGVGAQKPPTVYRALDWLIDIGLAERISTVSKFVAKPLDTNSETTAFLLCRRCDNIERVELGDLGLSLRATAKANGFSEEGTVIELMGVCADGQCANAKAKA